MITHHTSTSMVVITVFIAALKYSRQSLDDLESQCSSLCYRRDMVSKCEFDVGRRASPLEGLGKTLKAGLSKISSEEILIAGIDGHDKS